MKGERIIQPVAERSSRVFGDHVPSGIRRSRDPFALSDRNKRASVSVPNQGCELLHAGASVCGRITYRSPSPSTLTPGVSSYPPAIPDWRRLSVEPAGAARGVPIPAGCFASATAKRRRGK